MSLMNPADLLRLPKPKMIHDLDFEALLLDRQHQLNHLSPILFDESINPAFQSAELITDSSGAYWRVELPADAGLMFVHLESDPVTKQSEIASYRELLIRQRINDALAANLLALSTGSDLDHIAAFYDVKRLAGESDDAFRVRVQLSIRGWSPGTAEYYEFQVRSASNQIRDVLVDVPDVQEIDKKGWIYISIMQNGGDGSASAELLATVRNHLHDTRIRLINDTLIINSVELVPIDLTATIYLLPGALPGTLERIEASLPLSFDQARGLGWDVTRSWFTTALQQPGVKRSELSINADIPIAAHQCAYLRSFTPQPGGEQW